MSANTMTDVQILGLAYDTLPAIASVDNSESVIAFARALLAQTDKDAERMNAIANEYYRLDPFSMPTGADDADVGWRVSQYHMGDLTPRTVVEFYKDDPRAALDAAIAQQSTGKEA